MDHEPADNLRLHHCPQCGYDLTGLPREGRCPECGFEFDRGMFSLLGTPRRLTPAALAVNALVHVTIISLLFRQYTWCISSFGMAIGIAAWQLPAMRRLWQNEPEWLLFTSQGVSPRHRPGVMNIIPWQKFKRVTFFPVGCSMRRPTRTWEIHLHPEPFFALFTHTRRPRFIRNPARSIVFRIVATEHEARAICSALRERIMDGWAAPQ